MCRSGPCYVHGGRRYKFSVTGGRRLEGLPGPASRPGSEDEGGLIILAAVTVVGVLTGDNWR